jgi:hypothetical protein
LKKKKKKGISFCAQGFSRRKEEENEGWTTNEERKERRKKPSLYRAVGSHNSDRPVS